MKCRHCGCSAGLLRRTCAACDRLAAAFDAMLGCGMSEMFDALIATGADRDAIDRFLDGDTGDGTTRRDRLAAEAANQLMNAFGTRREQTVGGVQRLRERGAWRNLDRPPEDDGCSV